jgi:Tannase and feruloyl esterase
MDAFEIAANSARRLGTRATVVSLLAWLACSNCASAQANANAAFVSVKNAAAACTALGTLSIPAAAIGEPTHGGVVTSATYKLAVADAPPAAGVAAPSNTQSPIVQGTPDFCTVLIDIKPVDPKTPSIKMQLNLPTRWNGKTLQFGGSGYNGSLQTGIAPSRGAGPQVPLPLTQGYMTSGTDSGHQTARGDDQYAWALNDEALTNFAYAAYKKTHDVALFLGLRYYGKTPVKNYYMGGSEGGREAMTMAQRYPADYDGIIAVDPVMNWSGLQTFGNYVGGVLQAAPGGWLGDKWRLAAATIVAACDSLDGIADKVVANLQACKPAAEAGLRAKLCPSGGDEGSLCFSAPQLKAINAAQSGFQFEFPLANGITAYAGFGYGGEGLPGNWSRWVAGEQPPTTSPDGASVSRLYALGNGYVRYFIARDAAFDALTYQPAKFRARVQEVSAMMDATNPDLSAYYASGGKLILREDLADKAQSPYSGLDYWQSVVAKMGRTKVDEFFVAFSATGLPHTSGGIDPGTENAPTYGIAGRVDLLAVLEEWAEKGRTPGAQLTLANHQSSPPYAITASKPLCRYGNWPKFGGKSDAGGKNSKDYSCVADVK